ncbi:MAG: hypothetical protein VX589_06965 [Myxococcota bacterium]|nr:hypothetical protein [Myxococcota bacterium]
MKPMTQPERCAVALGKRLFVALMLLALLSACNKDSSGVTPGSEIVIDVGACLGRGSAEPPTAASCRWHIERQLDPDSTSADSFQGCIVYRIDGAIVSEAQPIQWRQGQLVLDGPLNINTTDGASLSAAVFIFASGVAATDCARLNPESTCDGTQNCLVRLGPDTAALNTRAPTILNFKSADSGRCLVETSAPMDGLNEVCDGIDNDCDSAVDENLDCDTLEQECNSSMRNDPESRLGRPCNVTLEGCLRTGLFQCTEQGEIFCDVNRGPPPVEVCNGLDDDCDGQIDEALMCTSDCADNGDCQNEADAPYCDSGTCAECISADNLGCTSDRPYCINGRCAECTPGTNVGCNEPARSRCSPVTFKCQGCIGNDDCQDDEIPICDADSGECRPCRSDDDCADGLCADDGRCVLCEPGGTRGCVNPGLAFCKQNGLACEGCSNDEQCQLAFPDKRVCNEETGICEVCDDNDRFAGCDSSSAPICDRNYTGPGAPCRPCNPEANNECRDEQVCVDGRCRGCNPAEPGSWNESCGEDSATPICDRNRRECVGCRTSDECALIDAEIPMAAPGRPDLLRPYCDDQTGRCRQCENQTDGCDPASDTPICQNGRCSQCASDDECRNHDGYSFCILDEDDPRVGRCVRCVDLEPGDGLRFSPGCSITEPRCNERSDSCQPCDKSGFFPCLAPFPYCQVDGRCLLCEPGESTGCDLTGAQPICDDTGQCRACNATDNCAGGRRCIGGRCVICDPANNAGCNNPDRPICDAETVTCQPCDPGDCGAGLVCTDGRCAGCNPSTNQNCPVSAPYCSPNATGELACGACMDDAPCARFADRGETVCYEGQCRQCDPQTNRGCGGVTPTCDPNTLQCIGCMPETCAGVCVSGVCRTCDPTTNDGCDPSDPTARVCTPEFECAPCVRSGDCITSTSTPNHRKICERTEAGSGDIVYRCTNCQSSAQCENEDFGGLELNYCIRDKCRLCRNGQLDEGIDEGCSEDAPTCTSNQNECVKCQNDDACSHQMNGQRYCEAVSGQCRFCVNSARSPNEIDKGCTEARPRCLDLGTRCAAAG